MLRRFRIRKIHKRACAIMVKRLSVGQVNGPSQMTFRFLVSLHSKCGASGYT